MCYICTGCGSIWLGQLRTSVRGREYLIIGRSARSDGKGDFMLAIDSYARIVEEILDSVHVLAGSGERCYVGDLKWCMWGRGIEAKVVFTGLLQRHAD